MNGHELDNIFYAWSVWSQEHGEVITKENVDGFVQGVREAIAAGASEGQAEPVAYLCEWGNTGRSVTIDKPEDLFCELPTKVTPLYTHPSVAIAALRERIAGMEKDAQRYRWLRQGGDNQQEVFDSVYGTSLDKQVDKAIAKEPK